MLRVPLGFFPDGVTGAVGMLDQKINRVNNANEHTDKQVCKKNGNNSNKKWQKLLPALLVHAIDHFWFCKIITRTDKNYRQNTIWDQVHQRQSKKNKEQQPNTMCKGRHFCFCSSLGVRRTANYNRRNGDASKQTA